MAGLRGVAGRAVKVAAFACLILAAMAAGRAGAQGGSAEERAVVAALDLDFRKNLALKQRLLKVHSNAAEHAFCQGWREARAPGWDREQNIGQLRSHVQYCTHGPWLWSGMAFFLHIFERAEAARRAVQEKGAACFRLAGERYVIFLRGPCQTQMGIHVLDTLETAVNQAVYGGASPPPKSEAVTKAPPRPPPRDDRVRPEPTQSPEPPQTDVEPPQDAVADLPFTPEELASAAGLAGGAALVGSLLLLGVSGVRRDEAIEAIRDLLRGRLPEDPYEAWKTKYEALGWRYREKNGVATFEPFDGARNEAGEVYSSAKGGFVRPEGEFAPAAPPPKDGDVNARGEVWSSFSGGYVDRKTFDQDMASRAELADKAKRDLADLARPDADVADLHRVIAETRRQGEEMRTFFTARDQLMDALAAGRRREGVDAILDGNREKLFNDLSERLRDVPDGAGGKDYRGALENLVPLADLIGNQMRPGYQPTYTYRDAVEDTLLQTGALALDAVLTKGAASAAVGGTLAMRDAVRDGADTAGILAAGAKAVATDYLFGKAVHLGAGLAGDALQAARGAAHTVADTVSDALAGAGRRSNVASDLVERMKRSLDTLDAGVHRESSGRLRASLTDVLEVQRNPHQVRALQHSGSSVTKEAFDSTLRNEVYRPHDQMLLEKLRQSSPDLADTKLMVHEVRTPGKAGSAINTDRDFRVLRQDASGQWIEVPKTKWEPHSHDAFAELTHFDSSKCPKGMSPAQQKAWWAEQHGHTPTDRAFREAGRDYSDQAVDAFGRRTQVGQARIVELKDIAAKAKDIADGKVPPPPQKVTLADPQGFAHQFHEKVTGNLRRGDPFEAIAQAKKGVETLDTVRTAYDAQKIATGELPSNLRAAMDVVKASNLPRLPDAAALRRLEADLGRLGYAGLDDFSAKLSSQFEGLKWAR